MFTGIVEKTLRIIGVAQGPMFRRLTMTHDWPDVKLGESIAINGVCLTIAEMAPGEVGFDVIQETLDKTNLGLLAGGDEVNVERALRAGDRIDGHFVQGHVDGVAPMVRQVASETEWRLTIDAPAHLARYLAPKGSICLDGISLTIAALHGNQFDVAIIPTTLKLTNLAKRQVGWPFNLEADIISKQIVQFLERREQGKS
jgi:riboflavin synthase